MTTQLIVALDFSDESEALTLISQLDATSCALKVGLQMFTKLGPAFVRHLVSLGYRVFLDLKYHDIPNTVSRACVAAAELGVWMVNIHASGGLKMMESAKNALLPFGNRRPLLIAVTVLTSMSSSELPDIGVNSEVDEQVSRLALLSKKAGLDGVVCSAHEATAIKDLCGKDFLTVTPGIRLPEDKADDQSRVLTPRQAVQAGSDFLVVGRPITRALNPQQVIQTILSDLS